MEDCVYGRARSCASAARKQGVMTATQPLATPFIQFDTHGIVSSIFKVALCSSVNSLWKYLPQTNPDGHLLGESKTSQAENKDQCHIQNTKRKLYC